MADTTYSVFWVTLSIASAIISSFTALELAKTASVAAKNRYIWLVGAASVMGVGVWAMHFIAMAAMKMPMTVYYETAPTLFSMFPAIISAGLAFFYIEITGGKTAHALLAAFILATGVIATHFLGMAGFKMEGHRIEHNTLAVVASYAIALLSSTLGFAIALRRNREIIHQLGGALILGLGISLTHYVDELTLIIHPAGAQTIGPSLEPGFEHQMAVAEVLAVCFLCTLLTTISATNRQFVRLRYTTTDNLRQSQKMEALGQLTGGIAHDFNNLLMIIQGSMDLMMKNPNPERLAILKDSIYQAITRGQGLTRQLLAFARRQSLDPKPLNVETHFREASELWRRPLPPNIELNYATASNCWPIDVDVDAFGVAILNLVVNARDAMPHGGELAISAANRTIRPASPLSLQLGTSGTYVEIAVRDTGMGMSPEVREHIFEPFFTTKDVGKGTGLGLAQVWGFVLQSQGHILVESEVGVGTTIRLFFPKGKDAPAPPETTPDTRLVRSFGTILMVEDDGHVARITRTMLNDMGFEVWWAAEAEAALEILKEQRPDVLFSDIILPGEMKGTDLAKHVQNTFPEVKILLATGYTPEADESGKLSFPVLRKPYTENDLIKALNLLAE